MKNYKLSRVYEKFKFVISVGSTYFQILYELLLINKCVTHKKVKNLNKFKIDSDLWTNEWQSDGTKSQQKHQ